MAATPPLPTASNPPERLEPRHATHAFHSAAERSRRTGSRRGPVRRARAQHRYADGSGHQRPGRLAPHPDRARRRRQAHPDPAANAQTGRRAAGRASRAGMNARLALDDADTVLTAASVLRRAEAARVYEVAQNTALEPASLLSERLGATVLLKREDQQPVFSFKLRGAYNRMAQLDAGQRARGVIAASAGNHAQGVALSAARLGIHAIIVMPVTAPQVKVDAVRRFGGEYVDVVLVGDSYS